MRIDRFTRYFLTGLLLCGLCNPPAYAQENALQEQEEATDPDEVVIENPVILYSGTQKSYIIGGFTVSGVDDYEDQMLINLSGLTVGQKITVPGDDISNAVKRYWKHGMFSYVSISATKIVGNKIYLNISLALRPKVTDIVYYGIKKGEQDDLDEKIGLIKGGHITPNMLDRSERLIRRYYDDKGFKNAQIRVTQRDDPSADNRVFVDVYIDKRDRIKVNQIHITGNEVLTDKAIKKVLKKTNEKGYLADFFRPKKFIDAEYEKDKKSLIDKYNELGYRDAIILADSITNFDDKTIDVYLTVEEGDKYYLRNINWIGNTVYNSEDLATLLKMKNGDVYNQKKLKERTLDDEDAIGNLYYNNGYVFYKMDPVEVNVTGDSVDLEMRIVEGPQATINKVNIYGNDRVYENVIRRELYTRPGDLFSRDALERSYRQIGQMGHFNPEAIDPQVKPNVSDGTVDIDWNLESKSNDQIELSAGWGQTGVIGKVALKFTNFSMYNLFHKSDNRRFLLPQGDGQTFSISGQTNGSYYHSYSVSFFEPWLGGKRPNSMSVSFFYSKQTDISDTYYNSSYYNNYYNYMYGGYGMYGNNYYGNNYYNYESYYDPDKYITLLGGAIGWGTRLHWPDDYFTFYGELSFTRYKLKDWSYFLINNGTCNNLNLGLTLSRNTTDNQIFPRVGSEFSLSVSFTPPYSLFDGINYEGLANDRTSATYQDELQQKHKWIEYHKWKFRAKTYTTLAGGQKRNLVLMTRAEFGILGHYNAFKRSPFETFYVGGDGMSGASYTYATEIVGLRGYQNGSLTPSGEGYAYSRLSAELRYPLMMENSTTIYALAFVEGGNAWTDIKQFNPFDMKRSAGVGIRVFLPMIGMIGLDWGYGFDPVYGSREYGGSQIHFILGQEF